MHGFVFQELKKYVVQKLGNAAWDMMTKKSHVEEKKYFPVNTYPDSEMESLLQAAAEITGNSRDEILEDFGAFLLPDLLRLYKPLLQPQWKTLELLENTERIMHTAVRYADKNASPPALVCKRAGPSKVTILYTSQRHMSAFGIGIIKAIGNYYGENLSVTTEPLHHEGKDGVSIHVEVIS